MASEVADQLEPWSCLHGKTVMVTGASSGLGREFCYDLAKAGCNIVAAARRMDRLKSLCDEINQRMVGGCRAVAVELDIASNKDTIEASVAKAWSVYGHIDALINNAGVRGQIRSSLDVTEEDWNQTLKTNLIGTWQVCRYVASQLRASDRGGSIINITLVSGLNRVQFHGGIAYSSSKSGVDSMTRVMAIELGEYNIRVNAIAPGLFPSEITEALFRRNFENMVMRVVPLRRGTPMDPTLTSLIRYLVHDSSGYVSGNIFIVEAGATLPGMLIYSSL